MADDMTVDDQEDQDGQPDSGNVEERLSKLERLLTETTKTLDEERKASAGKDKKITELAMERKKLQESTLSKDKLLEIREKELEESKKEWDEQRTAEKLELEKLRIESTRRDVVAKFPNFPSFLLDRVQGVNAVEIEADVRSLMNVWVKERDKVENVRKVGPRPSSGSGKQSNVTAQDVSEMSQEEQRKWAESATEDDFNTIFDELHTQ
jgi:hypothetical protein